MTEHQYNKLAAWASGSTGELDSDMLYHCDATGPQGLRYQLLKELHHTAEDTKKAKHYIRTHFDAVDIQLIYEKDLFR